MTQGVKSSCEKHPDAKHVMTDFILIRRECVECRKERESEHQDKKSEVSDVEESPDPRE